jgi:hypothetical protein
MPSMLAVVWLFAVSLLALSSPAQATAGPPEKARGRMALAPDKVADGLGTYRAEKDEGMRRKLLGKLVATVTHE